MKYVLNRIEEMVCKEWRGRGSGGQAELTLTNGNFSGHYYPVAFLYVGRSGHGENSSNKFGFSAPTTRNVRLRSRCKQNFSCTFLQARKPTIDHWCDAVPSIYKQHILQF